MDPNELIEMKYLEKQVSDVDIKVTSILTLLKGNELDKSDRGLIGEIKDHDKRLTGLEKLRDRLVWFIIGLSIPAGYGIIDIVKNITTKH